MNNNSFRQLSL